jgi:glycosyltransferase involved in cell wall biosynthesis
VEVARPDIEGLVFQSGNPLSLASQIETLILNPSLRETLGNAAETRALTYLTLERCVAEYDAVYREVLGTPDQ